RSACAHQARRHRCALRGGRRHPASDRPGTWCGPSGGGRSCRRPKAPATFLFPLAEVFEYLRRVGVGLYLGHDLLDEAVLVYYIGGAHDAHADLAIILLLLPDAVGLYGLPFRVGEQDEGQAVLLRKALVRGLGVPADAYDHNAKGLELGIGPRKGAGLPGAARRAVLG